MIYSALSTAIQQYCECYEAKFIANIPTFVQNAEQRIYNSVQLPMTRESAVLAAYGSDPSGATLLLPADFLSPFSLAFVVNGVVYSYLLQKDWEWLREAFPNDLFIDTPAYYALGRSVDGVQPSMRIAPVPDLVNHPGIYRLEYYAQPQSIVTAGETWLGDNFDSALLFGAIQEGYVFLKGQQDMLQAYEGKFQQQLGLLKALGDGKDRQDTYRTPQVKVQVQ